MVLSLPGAVQALHATAAAEAERKANSSKARIELEEQMKERQVLQLQQQVCPHCAEALPAGWLVPSAGCCGRG